jgi:hypothetical protein
VAGPVERTHAALVDAFTAAERRGDVDAMSEAALAMAGGRPFGPHAGRVPAYLHEAYRRATGPDRVRLAVALARVWAYGNDVARAVPFANEAVAGAERGDDPALLAQALDAALLVAWGPDDLAERLRITDRLDTVVAHLGDVEARLSAHLWRLTTALEALDSIAVQRQLRC